MSVFGYVRKDLYSRAMMEREKLEARVKELEESLEKLEEQRRTDESKYSLTLRERDELKSRLKELKAKLEEQRSRFEEQRELWARKLKKAGAVPDLVRIEKGTERLEVILPFVKTLQEPGLASLMP